MASCFGQPDNGQEQNVTADFGDLAQMRELHSSYIHGTIDLVISTRAGFVLATDSRATYSDGSHSDDAQKLFTVGKRAGTVIAGVIGAEIGMQGFGLRDAIAGYLLSLDERARADSVSASTIAQSFSHGFGGVAGLLLPGTRSSPSLVAGISAVSIDSSGNPEWVTFYLPLAATTTNNVSYYTVGKPIHIEHPLKLGLRFDVQAMGFPFVADQLLAANQPGTDEFSRTQIMRRYYERKVVGHLDEFSLDEAIDLAKVLIQATYRNAPDDAGVGGPIDIATVTGSGTTWIARKMNAAPPPPPYRARFFVGTFKKSGQLLDGLECVRCIFEDMAFTFSGDADVQLLGCEFRQGCSLTIKSGASRKMPQVVERLKRLMQPHCTILDEDVRH
jgi:20S proteasome alpha/beta subunit